MTTEQSNKLYAVVRRIRAEREMSKSFNWVEFITEQEMIYCMQAPVHYTQRKFTGQIRKPRVNTNPVAYGYRMGLTEDQVMAV
jgi:hypothetical protein